MGKVYDRSCNCVTRPAYDREEEAGKEKRPRDGLRAFMQRLQVEGTSVPTHTFRQQQGVLQPSPILTSCRARTDPQAQEPSNA